MSSNPTLIAGPFIGEVGWECFNWQPMVRKCFLAGWLEGSGAIRAWRKVMGQGEVRCGERR